MSQGKVDWKQKYYELRSKYMNAIDVSFKLGFEEGQKQAELENLQEQVAQAEEEAAMQEEQAMMGEDPMMGDEELPPEEGMEEGGDELDSSIDELEQFVKAENGESVDFQSLMKSFHKFEKQETKEDKSATKKKLDGILEKMDEQDAESQSDDDDVIGQA